MVKNQSFLNIADGLTPSLKRSRICIKGINRSYGKGDSEIFDFGNHYVGNVLIKFGYTGHHPDAPLFIRIAFCEHKSEIAEIDKPYSGWVSESWIQNEFIHVDELPTTVKLPRRYAFRYMAIQIIDTSGNYKATIEKITVNAYTSADDHKVDVFNGNKQEQKIDSVAIRTLRNCMQLVFEDGPKRDRRLWLGDLRLQALANYQTYKNTELVKRCLYLFAGCTLDDGNVASNIFTSPTIECDYQSMFDYSLFFINTLCDYYEYTKDKSALIDLFPTAFKQYELARKYFDENDIVRDSDKLGWCFVDWNLNLNKQAAAQAIYIYALNSLVKLCQYIDRPCDDIKTEIDRKKSAALNYFYDSVLNMFISGKDRQVSQATQIWMILAGVISPENGKKILESAAFQKAVKIVTPYMYHSYVEAWIEIGDLDMAKNVMLNYWGKMIDSGADTFFELFDPENPNASPYGGKAVNSYCHAWSCTPTYFLRKYFCL